MCFRKPKVCKYIHRGKSKFLHQGDKSLSRYWLSRNSWWSVINRLDTFAAILIPSGLEDVVQLVSYTAVFSLTLHCVSSLIIFFFPLFHLAHHSASVSCFVFPCNLLLHNKSAWSSKQSWSAKIKLWNMSSLLSLDLCLATLCILYFWSCKLLSSSTLYFLT